MMEMSGALLENATPPPPSRMAIFDEDGASRSGCLQSETDIGGKNEISAIPAMDWTWQENANEEETREGEQHAENLQRRYG